LSLHIIANRLNAVSGISHALTGAGQQRASGPPSSGNGGAYDERDSRLASLPNRVNQGRHAVAESVPLNIASTQENQPSKASRHSPEDGLSTQATFRDRRASSRPRSHSRDPSQQADRDTRTASAGTHMGRHYPQSASIVVQDEKSKSRERPVIRQLEESDNIDRESIARPVQGPRKDSLEQQPAHRGPKELPRKQPQRTVSDDGSLQRHPTINNSRRLSVTHGSGLPSISESGLFKTTRIVGDNKGPSEVMDERKFPWVLGKRLTILTMSRLPRSQGCQKFLYEG
jgi:hypothetical protein